MRLRWSGSETEVEILVSGFLSLVSCLWFLVVVVQVKLIESGMARILVVGSSCAGKTTLAQRLAQELGIHHIQLDAINWLPNWQERDSEEFLAILEKEVTTHPDWVIDGNYSRSRHVTWPRAEVVVWLNYSYPVVLWRAVRRTFRRVLTREALYSGNVETFRNTFLSKDSILLWVITRFHSRRRSYQNIRRKDTYSHLKWIELRRPSEADQIVGRLKEMGIIPQRLSQ